MSQCHDHRQHSQAPSLLACVWRSRLYVLLLACFLFSLGLSIILPPLPQLATNYFASQHAGRSLNCEDYSLEEQPPACQAAHSDVVRWASLNSLVANTFLGFFFAPLVGDLSDRLGRKPFMLAGITLALLPVVAIWAHITQHTSFIWYYPLNALTAVVAPIISFLSYTADVLQPELRTSGFGLITAAFSVGFMIGPTIGTILGASHGAVAAMGIMGVSLLLIAVGLPESYKPKQGSALTRGMLSAPSGTAAAAAVLTPSPAAVATAAGRRRRPLDMFKSMGRSWVLINSSSLFRRLALCMAVVGVVSEGIQDMLLQYLQLVMGFSTADQATLITVLGAGNFAVQALFLPTLVKMMGEQHLLVFGLLFSITEQALLALSVAKWQAIGAVSLSAFAGVSFPAISAIKSMHARPDQQGLVQGALAGIRAVASGLGPLGLAQLFAMSTTADAAFGYKPSIVFWTTCALTVLAAAIAASLNVPAAHKDAQDAHAACDIDADGDSSEDGTGAWLLGDEEDVRCKVKGTGGKEAQGGSCYNPPAATTLHQQQQQAVQQCIGDGKDSVADESALGVLVGSSGASDTESVGSDCARHSMEDHQQTRDQQRTRAGQLGRPSSSTAWHAHQGSSAAAASSSRGSSPLV